MPATIPLQQRTRRLHYAFLLSLLTFSVLILMQSSPEVPERRGNAAATTTSAERSRGDENLFIGYRAYRREVADGDITSPEVSQMEHSSNNSPEHHSVIARSSAVAMTSEADDEHGPRPTTTHSLARKTDFEATSEQETDEETEARLQRERFEEENNKLDPGEEEEESSFEASETPPQSNEPPDWYNVNERYFLYQPSGGLSNQRKIMEWALRVCQILKRVCVLPPIAPHTTWYYKYNAVPNSHLASAPDVFDARAMAADIAPVAALDAARHSLAQFVKAFENKLGGKWNVVVRNKLGEKREHPWPAAEVAARFGKARETFLYFAQGTMWQCFNFSVSEMAPIRSRVAFHPAIRTVARHAVDALYPPPQQFTALHIRFADGEANKVRVNWLKPASTFLYRMKVARFPAISSNLYVATVPSKRSHPYFNRFKAVYNVSFSDSLDRSLLHPLVSRYPPELRGDILGAVEQLICARAAKFLGTGFSTFSEAIRTIRRYRTLGADPTLEGKAGERHPVAVRERERAFLEAKTLCRFDTQPC